MNEKVTDEMLMAYVDGELGGADADAIASRLDADPALAARAEAFSRSRTALASAFAPVSREPVPEALVRAALGAAPLRRRALPSGWMPAAMAASVAVLAGLGGYLLGQGGPVPLLGVAAGTGFAEALAGAEAGAPVAFEAGGLALSAVVLASVMTDAGPCRIFEAEAGGETARGVACHAETGWHVPLVAGSGDQGLYRAASEAGIAAIDTLLDEMGAGPPLDAEDEAALIARGWAVR